MRRILLIALLAAAAHSEQPLWVAVGPPQLLEPLAPLVATRRAQGFEAVVLEGHDEGIKSRFPRPPRYVLLVGDDERGAAEQPWRVASAQLPLYRWRAVQRETFASDARWADQDGDGAADCPVGRIPARTPEEVKAVVAKILAFERRAASPDDLRILSWGGSPGYGGAIDTMATGLMVTTIRKNAPPWAVPWIISADPAQPYCGWPPEQPDLFAAEMRRGALFGAGLAHGNADGFFSMRHGLAAVWFGPKELARGFPGEEPAPPLLLISCECGEFDRAEPCIAERALFLPGGPVAAVGATTESHPLTNYFTGVALLKSVAAGTTPRLGDLWLDAQRRGSTERDFIVEQMLKDAEGKLEDPIDVKKLRRDQPLLYCIFGDPALRLQLPTVLEATAERRDGKWRWKAKGPPGATRLVVGLKPSQRDAKAPPAGDEAAGARARFLAANAAEEFDLLEEKKGEGAWEGETDRPGLLRLVAVGPDGVAVKVLELK